MTAIDHRKMQAARDVLAWHAEDKFDGTGPGPRARFTLDDGTEIEVTHEGDHLTIRNIGTRTTTSRLTIDCSAANSIDMRGT
jgi:hypothetical protein